MLSPHDVIMMLQLHVFSLLLTHAVERKDAAFTSCLIYCNYVLPVGREKALLTGSLNTEDTHTFWMVALVMGCACECVKVLALKCCSFGYGVNGATWH